MPVNPPLRLDLADKIQQLLRAPHGKAGNHHIAAAVKGLLQNLRQFAQIIRLGTVAAVAVSRFHHQIIGVRRHGGVLDQRLVQVADIARKHQCFGAAPRLSDAQRDGRAAQQMPHIGEQHLDFSCVTVKKCQPSVVGAGDELAHDLLRVLHGVVRLDRRRTAALRLAVFPLDLLLLDVRRVLQHNAAQIGGGIGGVNGGAEPVLYR